MEARFGNLFATLRKKVITSTEPLTLRPCTRFEEDDNDMYFLRSTYQVYQGDQPMLMWIRMFTAIVTEGTQEELVPWRNRRVDMIRDPRVTPTHSVERSIYVQIEIANEDDTSRHVFMPSQVVVKEWNLIRLTPSLEHVNDSPNFNICINVINALNYPRVHPSNYNIYLKRRFNKVKCVIKNECHASNNYGLPDDQFYYDEKTDGRTITMTVFPDTSSSVSSS